MLTWTSFDSPNNLKGKSTDEDSVSLGGLENQDEDQETKDESGRSNSTRRSRAAAVHNQSERRRRDRINQKMKALQKLVPNSSKTDKASMLDEVIEYLKQLQAQVHVMNTVRTMQQPAMVMPHQQLQMSLMAARMGMGFGMGMLDINSMARAATSNGMMPHQHLQMSPPFMAAPRAKPVGAGGSASGPTVPLPDPYYALLAQSMNMDLYSKMAAFYSQQVSHAAQSTGSPSRSNHGQVD